MVTGRNTGLSMTLMLEQYRLFGKGGRGMRPWVDAGYCIDAPEIMAAGSMVRDEFGPEIDDWLAMESMVEREPSNVQAQGAGGGLIAGGSLGAAGSAAGGNGERK